MSVYESNDLEKGDKLIRSKNVLSSPKNEKELNISQNNVNVAFG